MGTAGQRAGHLALEREFNELSNAVGVLMSAERSEGQSGMFVSYDCRIEIAPPASRARATEMWITQAYQSPARTGEVVHRPGEFVKSGEVITQRWETADGQLTGVRHIAVDVDPATLPPATCLNKDLEPVEPPQDWGNIVQTTPVMDEHTEALRVARINEARERHRLFFDVTLPAILVRDHGYWIANTLNPAIARYNADTNSLGLLHQVCWTIGRPLNDDQPLAGLYFRMIGRHDLLPRSKAELGPAEVKALGFLDGQVLNKAREMAPKVEMMDDGIDAETGASIKMPVDIGARAVPTSVLESDNGCADEFLDDANVVEAASPAMSDAALNNKRRQAAKMMAATVSVPGQDFLAVLSVNEYGPRKFAALRRRRPILDAMVQGFVGEGRNLNKQARETLMNAVLEMFVDLETGRSREPEDVQALWAARFPGIDKLPAAV